MQVRLLLEKIFAPYMDGLSSVWGVTPEEGLHLLISENTTFDQIAQNNPQALKELLSIPEVNVIITIAAPIRDVSDEWIKEQMNTLLDVMKDIRPTLARGIMETPGGTEWFYESLIGIKKILFGT